MLAIMARISLEDNFTDIISKAQRGLGLTDAELCARARVSRADLQQIKSGTPIESALKQLAVVLELSPPALVQSAKEAWYPKPVQLAGLAQFTTPYNGMLVNAYVVWDPASREAAVFDTGAEIQPLLQHIQTNRLTVKLIFLTHSHSDHMAELPYLKEKTKAPAYISEKEPVRGAESFAPSRVFRLGRLPIETRPTSGHSRGGTTYVVSGLAHPVAVVGDALFAGSMGGGLVSYREALANNRSQILTLPDDTIVCPGHGPLTTVGEEKRHNPFFPEFQKQ